MNEKEIFTTRIDPDILKRLKNLAVDVEIPISDLTEEALQDLLKKYEKKDKK